MTDTVLLTGITGFLGGHIAKTLLEEGYRVRGSLRNPGPDGARQAGVIDALQKAGADTSNLEFVTLDLLHDEGWATAAKDARFVIHAASPFVTHMPKDPQDLIRPAVAGTERALTAAVRAGVERVVLTSSMVAIVPGRGKDRPQRLGAEDWSRPEDGRLNAYAISKIMAEKTAWELSKQGLDLAVINPGFIIGPLLDDDPGTSGAIFQRMLRGDFPMVPRLFLHSVDVRDIARIHVRAMTDPAAVGKRHPATFEVQSLLDMATILRDAFPEFASKLPKREAPDWLVRILAIFDADIRGQINELGYAPELDAEAALRILGQKPIPVRTAIIDMAKSLIARELL